MQPPPTLKGAALPHRLDVDLDSTAFDSRLDPLPTHPRGDAGDSVLDFGDAPWAATAVDPTRAREGLLRIAGHDPHDGPDDGPESGNDLLTDTAPSDADASAGPTIGHIGRYALKRRIGEGGLGTVYAAHDPLLSRLVAIKTLNMTVDSTERESVEALFLNEARAAAGLSHPHIVTVYDAGASDEALYIAMELLKGRDLRQLRDDGWRATPQQAALIVRRVAEALGYAHAKGVVHRDIKPANIYMIARTQPRVLDFGIARVAHQHDLLGEPGVAAGSPYYMAPEQLRREAVDRRVDVYALGVVFYELLTGVKPFAGDGLDAIVASVLNDTVVPAHEVDSTVPPALSAIAARAMARNPADRFRSARAMARELRQWHDGAGAATAPVAPAAGVRSDRRRGLMIGAAGGAAVLTLALWRLLPTGPTVPVAAPVATAAPSAPAPAATATATATATASAPATEPDTFVPETVTLATAASAPPEAAPTASAASASASASPPARPPVAPATRPPGTADDAPAAVPRAAADRTPARPTAAQRKARAGTHVGARTEAASAVAPAVLPTGVVQLAISPWGQIEVDGKPAGIAPPLTRLTLSEGPHTLVVRNDDYPPYTLHVVVTPDQPVTVKHKFLP